MRRIGGLRIAIAPAAKTAIATTSVRGTLRRDTLCSLLDSFFRERIAVANPIMSSASGTAASGCDTASTMREASSVAESTSMPQTPMRTLATAASIQKIRGTSTYGSFPLSSIPRACIG